VSLGIGDYRVLIYERGSARFIADLGPLVSSAEYGIPRNSIGQATVDLAFANSPSGSKCAADLTKVEPWAHELAIVRNGELAFTGPVSLRPLVSGDSGTLTAVQMPGWLDVRFARNDRLWAAGVDGSTFVSVMLQDALLVDDPQMLNYCEVRPGIATVHRDILAIDDEIVYTDVLGPMLGATFDMVSMGRKTWFWPAKQALGYIPHALSASDFGGAWDMFMDGALFASRYSIHGDQSTGVRGVAGGVSGRYGLVERRFDDSDILDSGQAAAMAQLQVSGRPPVTITGAHEATLSCDSLIDFHHLVPGCYGRVSLIAEGEQVDRYLRLEAIKVTINTDEKNLAEAVSTTWTDVERTG
jgi:hypothetical protein